MRRGTGGALAALAIATAAPAAALPSAPTLPTTSTPVTRIAAPDATALFTDSAGTVLASGTHSVRAYDASGRLLGQSASLNAPRVMVDYLGSAWALTFDSRVVRIDPKTAAVQKSIPVRSPHRLTMLAGAGGYLWTTTSDTWDSPLLRVDPRTGAATRAAYAPGASVPTRFTDLSSNPSAPNALLVGGMSNHTGYWLYDASSGVLVPTSTSDPWWRVGSWQDLTPAAPLAADGLTAYVTRSHLVRGVAYSQDICRQDLITDQQPTICYLMDGVGNASYQTTTFGPYDYVLATTDRSSGDHRPNVYVWNGAAPGAAAATFSLATYAGSPVVGPDQRSVWLLTAPMVSPGHEGPGEIQIFGLPTGP